MAPNTALLEKQAIKAAINQNWNVAVDINQEILAEDPENIACLNRLGLAFLKLGQICHARRTYQKVLKLDGQNNIAAKTLERLGKVNSDSRPDTASVAVSKPAYFLEEPGKTKIVKLTRLTSAEILSCLSSGDQVYLTPKKRAIGVVNNANIYLGCLPEDLSSRLLVLINGGNKYEAYIKSVGRTDLILFIRETHRSKRFHNRPSFTASSSAQLAYLGETVPDSIDRNEPPTDYSSSDPE